MLRPDDELPKREIATLTVLLHQSRDSKFEGDKKSSFGSGAKAEELTHEQRLLQRIRRNPKDLAGYDELAGLYLNSENFTKAVEVLNQKLEAVKGTDQENHVVETIEDVHLKVLRSKWIAADAKAKKSGKEADAKEVQAVRAELVEKELQTYRNRCERYPNNLAFRFELGRRYQLNGNIPEAIRECRRWPKPIRETGRLHVVPGRLLLLDQAIPPGDEPLRKGDPGHPRPRPGQQEEGLFQGRQARAGAKRPGQGRQVPHDAGQHGLRLPADFRACWNI